MSSLLDQAGHWDPATRELVESRVASPPPFRFFSALEVRTLEPFCDLVTGQGDRREIPVLRFIDDELFRARLPGFRHAGMPDDRDVWRLVAQGLDEHGFADLSHEAQLKLIQAFVDGELRGGAFAQLDVGLAWKVVMAAVIQAFYAHPLAWEEIGFGGPAYPRGYSRLGAGQRESWQP
ncbi:MAG: gluconate 2-dehydrogenase subunit 3 family protein [Solirubrobacterales bacterium]|nr:gluconate 2-dehydrogenase subunit 3 family protein [Solirubrobacterales bacterium]